jgi:hypothetical protein
MVKCHVPKADMLPNPIHIKVEKADLDFNKALVIAKKEAEGYRVDAMLLSWYDKKRDFYSPQVECCGEDEPSWVVYAKSRGGDLTIDINDEEYVFIFRGKQEGHNI